MEWRETKTRATHLGAQGGAAKSKVKAKRPKNLPGRHESLRPSTQAPCKGLALTKREEAVLRRIDDREKRLAEVDKAISMTSSRLPTDVLHAQRKEEMKKVSELEDVQTVTADLKSHGAPGVLSELMSYRGQQRINNSKLSHFSPSSLENGKQDADRVGITTPKNDDKNLENMGRSRKTYSASKENKKKSGPVLTPLDVKISSKEDDSDGTADNRMNNKTHPDQRTALTQNPRTDEGPMTPHEM